MEGCREEYLSNKGRFHAMFLECLDNASLSLDSTTIPTSPELSPSLPPTLDDDVILAPLANLCVSTTFPANTNFDFSLYSLCARFPSPDSPLALASIDFNTTGINDFCLQRPSRLWVYASHCSGPRSLL